MSQLEPASFVITRVCLSTLAISGLAFVLVQVVPILPEASRRTEIVFIVAFLLLVSVWSLLDALVKLARSRRRMSRR